MSDDQTKSAFENLSEDNKKNKILVESINNSFVSAIALTLEKEKQYNVAYAKYLKNIKGVFSLGGFIFAEIMRLLKSFTLKPKALSKVAAKGSDEQETLSYEAVTVTPSKFLKDLDDILKNLRDRIEEKYNLLISLTESFNHNFEAFVKKVDKFLDNAKNVGLERKAPATDEDNYKLANRLSEVAKMEEGENRKSAWIVVWSDLFQVSMDRLNEPQIQFLGGSYYSLDARELLSAATVVSDQSEQISAVQNELNNDKNKLNELKTTYELGFVPDLSLPEAKKPPLVLKSKPEANETAKDFAFASSDFSPHTEDLKSQGKNSIEMQNLEKLIVPPLVPFEMRPSYYKKQDEDEKKQQESQKKSDPVLQRQIQLR